MSKEHDKIATHNLDASPEVVVVRSSERQKNHRDGCGLVALSGSKVHEVNFSTTL